LRWVGAWFGASMCLHFCVCVCVRVVASGCAREHAFLHKVIKGMAASRQVLYASLATLHVRACVRVCVCACVRVCVHLQGVRELSRVLKGLCDLHSLKLDFPIEAT
jgi:hypothetical protein